MNNAEALELLSDLLPGVKPKAEKKAKVNGTAKKKVDPNNRPLEQLVAIERTGLIIWKATARVCIFQIQECTCCGSRITAVDQEFFELENGQLHNLWRRTEGYGIDAPENLPIKAEYQDTVRKVSACAECINIDINLDRPIQMDLGL